MTVKFRLSPELMVTELLGPPLTPEVLHDRALERRFVELVASETMMLAVLAFV